MEGAHYRSKESSEPRKQKVTFKSTYSTKDFIVAEEIIDRAEKIKLKRIAKVAGDGNADAMKPHTLTLSDIIEGYRYVMRKQGFD